MVKTCSMTQNQSDEDDDASGEKRFRTHDYNGGPTSPWSDINHHVLSLIMMQLGLVDYIAFGGVCKSWRSFAFSERSRFLASRPLMSIHISRDDNKEYYFEDFEGRKFKTIIPHSANSACIGLTCGYLILFNRETRDFWLVNPITRHEIHFPDFPIGRCPDKTYKAILIFSPSLSRLVFVVLRRYTHEIWFSIVGKGAWNYVYFTSVIYDVHAFKGMIYALLKPRCCELRFSLGPKSCKLRLLETKLAPNMGFFLPWFASSAENLFVIEDIWKDRKFRYRVHKIDFGQMKWVLYEKAIGGYAFFVSSSRCEVVVNPELWAHPRSRYGRFVDTHKRGEDRFFTPEMWYFHDECLNVDIIDE